MKDVKRNLKHIYFSILEKCPSPSVIRAYQLFSKIIITWESPNDILQYELQYKEATQATSNWILVPIMNGAFNATVSSVKLSASYVARLRCLPKGESCSICVWSEEISIPHKLTEKPTILENTVKEISQGKMSIFLKWKTTQNKNTMGYHISIERIPSYCTRQTSLNISENWLYLNLSMAYYRIRISAYNEAGESPAVTCLIPGFTTADLPGQINVSNHQNHTVISWNLKYTPNYIVIDWGTGIKDMDLEIISGRTKSKTLGHLQPYQLYKVMLHAFHGRCEDFMKHEWTFGMTYFYAVEGDEGEFERILAGLCFGIILTMLFVVMVYSIVFKRLSLHLVYSSWLHLNHVMETTKFTWKKAIHL
ncbi:hypothetical protein JD844_008609 [Phrynosoma platyrhinos]|uniref:Fibronectin type-III domain-containing protein n=1 Tax=Phrynosoma platyrhinos TaxID=52577 RepID=A0ABQ7TEX9_PHRPL|nr:hypothetical protein JD844_008609 [Phrynosoma platyrhinos]